MTERRIAPLALALFAAILVAGVFLRPLTPVDETRYLSVAWDMHLTGDYLVPTRNFELYTHKPPLLFWLVNALWALFGVSETLARLVGPAFALGCVALAGPLARRLWPEDAGIAPRATLAMAGMFAFAMGGSLTMFDAMLTFMTMLGILALLAAVGTGRRRWWAALGAAMALGVLSKGPVILFHLLPAALLVPFWAAEKPAGGYPAVLRGVGLALLTGLALVSLWLVPAILAGGEEYRDAVLWKQSAGRMASSFAHRRPWWFFLAALPFLLFPWIWLPSRWRAVAGANWRDAGLRLCLVWAGAALLLFSATSGKQVHYLLPELPAVALIVARVSGRDGAFPVGLAALPAVLLALAAIAAALGLAPLGETSTLFAPRQALLGWGLMVIAICWIGTRQGGLAGGAFLSMLLILSINLLIGLTETRAIYDTHRIARAVAPHEEAGIAFYRRAYNAEFNFTGRLTAPVATPKTPDELGAWVATHPDGVIVAEDDARGAPAWPPRETVLYRNSPYSVWHAADMPGTDMEKTS